MRSPRRLGNHVYLERHQLEILEPRTMLAADLEVIVEPFKLESAGQEVTRLVRVTNNGDEDAVDAVVRSVLSEQLEDAEWQRTAGLANFVHREPPVAEHFQTIRGLTDVSHNTPNVIGDVNADGLTDYFVATRNGLGFLVFGSEGITQLRDIRRRPSEVDEPVGVFLKNGGTRWASNVGDVNGDSVDDLAFDSTIIFGSPKLGETGPIDLSEPSGSGFRVPTINSSRPVGIGDVNADGFDDLVVRQKLILGSDTIGEDGTLPLDDNDSNMIIELPFHEYEVHNAGDINNDGFDDFGFGLNVVLGGPNYIQAGKELTWAAVKPTLANGWGFESHPIKAGDVNGDGIDDLVYSMYGPIADTTASGKGIAYVRNGINVVYGSPMIVDSGTIDVESVGLTMQLTTNYYRRSVASTEDVNRDGIADIVLSTSGRQLVVFGGSDLTDMDFGFQDFDRFDSLAQVFDGENGLATDSIPTQNWRDSIQRDGDSTWLIQPDFPSFSTDTYHISSLEVPELWTPPSESSATGAGDILDQVTIPAGESVAYAIRGTLKADASDTFHSSAVASPKPDGGKSGHAVSSLTDKARTGQTNVDVEVTHAHTPLKAGQPATFEVLIDNYGLQVATDVEIIESFTTSLSDSTWSLETTRLFPENVRDWPTVLPSINGFVAELSEDEDLTFGEYRKIGNQLRALGDTNDDGFDDFSVNGTVYLGSEDFADRGFGVTPARPSGEHDVEREVVTPTTGHLRQSNGTRTSFLQQEAKAYGVGDLNGDRLRDFLVVDESGETAMYLVFGDENQNETIDLTEHPIVELPDRIWLEYVVAPKLDLNGDRVLDAVFAAVTYAFDGNEGLFVIEGDHDLGSQPIVPALLPNTPLNPDYVAHHDVTTGDFNGDTHTDLALTAPAGVTIYFGGTDSHKIAPLAVPANSIYGDVTDLAPNSLRLDVNGDGIDDLLIGQPSDPPRSEFGGSGSVSMLLGRRATAISGEGEIDSKFSIAPGEQLQLRITGTVTEEMLAGELAFEVVASEEQFEMNPFNNRVAIEPTDKLFADIDGNESVDFGDFLILSSNFGQEAESLFEGDLNGDRRVDFADFLLLHNALAEAVLD